MRKPVPRNTKEQNQLIGLGSHIRELRQNRGWTQYHLADHSGLDQTFISLIERGIPNVSFRTILKIAAAFKMPVSALLAPLMEGAPAQKKRASGGR